MKKALIISLSPNIGHLSHVIAYYNLFEELGYKSAIYVLPGAINYLPKEVDAVTSIRSMNDYDVALMYSPCFKNIQEALRIKLKSKCKLIYVYHEPLGTKQSFRDAGFSWLKTQIIFLKDKVNCLLIKMADHIILSSKKALEHYENGAYKKINQNYTCISLIFTDENNSKFQGLSRLYFSYIGTVAADHSFNEFLQFVEWAVKENKLTKLQFLIATKSEFEVPQTLVNSPSVVIQKGRPLSDEEINAYYASTLVVWNAYARTTQSGVLAKSFMFGTPAIVLKRNLSEFTKDGQEVVAIDDNTSFEEIGKAILEIIGDFNHYSTSARKRFEDTFYYRKYNEKFKEILSSL